MTALYKALWVEKEFENITVPKFELVFVNRIRRAVTRLALGDVDLVILSLDLWDCEGFGALIRIVNATKMEKNIPVLVIGDDINPAREVALKKLGACNYLDKNTLVKPGIECLFLDCIQSLKEHSNLKEDISRHQEFMVRLERGEVESIIGGKDSGVISVVDSDKLDEIKNNNLLLESQQDKLHEASRELKSLVQRKNMLMGSLSHEIRTPLHGIMGMVELLLNATLSKEEEKYARSAYDSCDHLLAIVNDVVDLAKAEHKSFELEVIKSDLQEVLRKSLSSVQILIKNKNLKAEIKFAKNLAKYYMLDPVRIQQIVTNLLTNAIKFTDKGGITIKITNKPISKSFDLLRFEVIDTGVGIAPAKIDMIFDEYLQAETSTTREHGGTGLGLAICRKLVQHMKGKIGVLSELKKGTTFWFEIPLSRVK